ncbi:MAG TPA: apolipoprotein N-acyltransferase [Candidatus Sumerlaeota bacterium]|nr:apolipoprotein N-acyltransferase [Candidatus Sumerlaeota bacterium]HOR26735.1 apolipoprotein N-acyltransferase [Candidatus Sumerlaeota bacterium]HPK02307.1 apolipoprotein N-acyltransferase [Candidatus Sumerlaeota bacterium]
MARRLRNALRDPGYWLAAAGGLCGVLAFDPYRLRPLIVLAPLLAWLAVRAAATPGAAFRRLWLFGWVFTFGALKWLWTLFWVVGNPFIYPGVVLLGAYLGLYYALAGWITRRWLWTPREWPGFVAFASLWLLSEWLRTLGRLAMPMPQVGHALAAWPWAIQIASLLGEAGVSLGVLLTAGWLLSLLRLIQDRGGRGRCATRRAALTSTLLLLIFWSHNVGSWLVWRGRVASWASAADARPLDVAMIQPNIDQISKLMSYYPWETPERRREAARLREVIAARNERLVEQDLTHRPDLIVMPETAYTELDFYSNERIRERVAALARRAGADIVFGAGRDMSAAGRDEIYNSTYLVRADGSWDDTIYDKVRLVPFGETVPYFDIIPGLQESVVGIGSFNAGQAMPLFETGGLQFGALICFESTFHQMARRYARQGADFLVVMTNDAWYLRSAGAPQHHNLSLLRAVETRRWLLRSANTGISSTITPAGEISRGLGLEMTGVVEDTLWFPPRQGRTVFTRAGNAWLAMPFLFCAALFIWKMRAGKPA